PPPWHVKGLRWRLRNRLRRYGVDCGCLDGRLKHWGASLRLETRWIYEPGRLLCPIGVSWKDVPKVNPEGIQLCKLPSEGMVGTERELIPSVVGIESNVIGVELFSSVSIQLGSRFRCLEGLSPSIILIIVHHRLSRA